MNPEDNRASWQQVLGFVAEYPDDHAYWSRWKSIVSPILAHAMELEFDALFRAGQSMQHVIFSTLDHHGLREEPRVTLEVMRDWRIRISFTRNNVHFYEPVQFVIMDDSLAFESLRRYLRHLWEETMPEAVPECLRKTG